MNAQKSALASSDERIFSYALSIKQPWAALIAARLKTVEIRSWRTSLRGLVYLHASRTADDRPQGWDLVEKHKLQQLASLRGGLIGFAKLAACLTYASANDFNRDIPQHCNAPSWFVGKTLYGFELRYARAFPFRPLKGGMRFFRVETQLLPAGRGLSPLPNK